MIIDAIGLWRSLVARYLGVVEVVGSNPASPTIWGSLRGAFFLCVTDGRCGHSSVYGRVDISRCI